MSLLNQLGRQPQGGNVQNAQAALQEIQQGPAAFMNRYGFQVPADLRTPQQIIQHLLSSGQVTQDRLHGVRKQLGI